MPTVNFNWWRRIISPLKNIVRRRGRQSAQDDDRALVMSLSPSRIPSFKQLKFLPRLISPQERRLIRFCLTIAAVSFCVLVVNLIRHHVVTAPAEGGTLTEGIVGTPQYLNPVLARPYSADAELNHLLFRGLVKVDDHLKVVPDLAQSLTVSADGKIYTAALKPNLKWSDGSALTAEDVRYTYETIADTGYQSPIQSLYKNMTVTAPDAKTVVFTLPAAYEPFRASLTLGILPAKLWQDQSAQTFSLGELNIKPVGNGPYMFQNITKDRNGNIRGFTFIRNKYFSGPEPRINKIAIKIYSDPTSALDALTTNAIDSYGGINAVDLTKVKKSHKVSTFNLSQLTGIFFNQKNNPAIKVKEVRQALAMTVDRASLIKTAFGGVGKPADGPLLPNQPGFAADVKAPALDVAGANALLDQAGWKRGDSGTRSKNNQSLAFSITTVDDPSYIAAANKLAAAWKTIGANVDVKTVGIDRVQKDVIKPRAYDALLFGEISNADADPFQFWHSSQQQGTGFALAIGYYKNIDQDLESAQKSTDPKTHDAALHDFQAIVAAEVPAIILTQTDYLYAHKASLHGIPTNTIVAPANRFDSITNWYVKTRWSWK